METCGKVLIKDKLGETALNIFKNNNYEITYDIEDCDIICIRSKTKITKEIIDKAKNLKVIGCFCIGTNNVDLDYALEKGIPVFNCPSGNTRSVAEYTIAQIINLSRQLREFDINMSRNIWNKYSTNCFEIKNKTLGIIGLGNIGKQVSVIAESLGMNVLYYDIKDIVPIGNAKKCEDLNSLFKYSNFITIHVPLLESTKNLVNKDLLNQMTSEGQHFIINASRGGVLNHNDLYEALVSNKLDGAVVDVFPNEPLKSFDKWPLENSIENKIIKLKNVIFTPHIAGSTEESQSNIGIDVATKIVNYLKTGRTISSVNFPELVGNENSIINIHKNIPGSLSKINNILSKHNIITQELKTKNKIGCCIFKIEDQNICKNLIDELNKLDITIFNRIL